MLEKRFFAWARRLDQSIIVTAVNMSLEENQNDAVQRLGEARHGRRRGDFIVIIFSQ